MDSEIKIDELGGLMVIIDQLYGELSARQIHMIEIDRPEIVAACKLVHRVLWHNEKPQ